MKQMMLYTSKTQESDKACLAHSAGGTVLSNWALKSSFFIVFRLNQEQNCWLAIGKKQSSDPGFQAT